MAFYDNFTKRAKPTKLGLFIIKKQNIFYTKLIKKYCKKSKITVLEIGPGKGHFAQHSIKNNFIYTGIEPNFQMYSNLKKKGFNIINAKTPPIPLKKKFDVIFLNQVFEHMQNIEEAKKLLNEIKKKLNKSGLLIISVPDVRWWKEDFWASDYTHMLPLSAYSLKQLFQDYDFTIVYQNLSTLNFKGNFFAKMLRIVTSSLYYFGILNLLFSQKAYKIKNLGNASCIVIGQK